MFRVIGGLLKEGERLGEIKSLSFSVETLRNVRKLVQLYYFALVANIFFTACTFILIQYAATVYLGGEPLVISPFLIIVATIWAATLAFSVWLLGEKRWMAIFKIQNRVDRVLKRAELSRSDNLLDRRQQAVNEKLY